MSITKTDYSAIALAIVAGLSLFFYSLPAHANPLRFQASTQTSSATSSPVYMTPGAATSTLIYDAYANAGGTQAADRILLLTQLNASSTATTLNIGLEYSQGVSGADCSATPTACDWYQDEIVTAVNATNTLAYLIATPNSYSYKFASTTQGGAIGATDRGLKAISIPVLARYTRVVYTMTGFNGSVWGQVVPQKQSN